MDNTQKFDLPLVQASQSQKHVTVNEAVTRLEAMSQLRLDALPSTVAPLSPEEGAVYPVASAATGDWVGQDGRLAIFANGGWEFVTPVAGWRGWQAALQSDAVFDGVEWVPGACAVSPNGAAMTFEVFETDHVLTPASTSETSAFIPAGTVVFAVTGRVITTVSGATSFALGIAGESPDRYGSGYGVAEGAFIRGITGQPVTYYTDTALTFSATGGDFAGGAVRLSVHGARFAPPRGS